MSDPTPIIEAAYREGFTDAVEAKWFNEGIGWEKSAAKVEAARMNTDRMIRVWRFEDAPKELQDLSTNGGDEDWLAVVPASMDDDRSIGWLEEGGRFGCCCVDAYKLPNGDTVYIGAHA